MKAITTALATLCLTTTAHANGVSLGGLMNHLNVGVAAPVNGTFPLTISFDTNPGDGLEMVLGEPPLEEPFNILEDRAYNAQYGWLRQGRWGPGPGEGVFIELIDATPGLSIYEGAFGTDANGGTSDDLNGQHTLAPIFGTEDTSTLWQWDGRMTHHWVVSDAPGNYEATFQIYVAENLNGAPGDLSPTFLPGEITLAWIDNVSQPITYTLDDINQLAADLRNQTTTPTQDYNNSGTVTFDDYTYLIQTLIGTVPGDTNLDFTVDLIDLSNLATHFNLTPGALWQQGDTNADGTVDLIDLSNLATHFGTNLNQVPEPIATSLLITLALMSRRACR
ncbi:dockerin type I domain-containing protein [Mucisphaera sp.]|uniref:dockerin type I domain-containing protein n=1 Tax=Mucisphaera sp. TaxID=2913024 RepID=UPI003D0BA599